MKATELAVQGVRLEGLESLPARNGKQRANQNRNRNKTTNKNNTTTPPPQQHPKHHRKQHTRRAGSSDALLVLADEHDDGALASRAPRPARHVQVVGRLEWHLPQEDHVDLEVDAPGSFRARALGSEHAWRSALN
eukprot:556260-Rhodomonas_salina.1